MEGYDLSSSFFILQGFGAALSFNAVLNALPFLHVTYTRSSSGSLNTEQTPTAVDITFYLHIALLLSAFLITPLMIVLSRILSLKRRTFATIGYSALIAVLLPFVYTCTENNTTFYSICGMLLLLGVLYQILYAGALGTALLFYPSDVSVFYEGAAVGALAINCLKGLIGAILNPTGLHIIADYVLFFIACTVLMLLVLIVNVKIFGDEFYIYHVQPLVIPSKEQLESPPPQDYVGSLNYEKEERKENGNHIFKKSKNNDKNIELKKSIDDIDLEIIVEPTEDTDKNLSMFFSILVKNSGLNTLACLLLGQTYFLLTEYIILAATKDLNDLWPTWTRWGHVALLVIYNGADWIGRRVSRFSNSHSSAYLITAALLRIGLMGVYFFIEKYEKEEFVLYIVVKLIVLGMSHGYLMTWSTIAMMRSISYHEKEVGGFVIAFVQTLGMLCGSFTSCIVQHTMLMCSDLQVGLLIKINKFISSLRICVQFSLYLAINFTPHQMGIECVMQVITHSCKGCKNNLKRIWSIE
eukprot:TRINITY_DN790_c0_g1_i11.p1 TRINITY_DN790_c0_g1~~TRINITY_DN790_c0_g1_i11.p1  ORF type:complete len:525 (-),score=29.05 TRINITY_DN790_c0_g1_i11:665-2239(-)